MNCRLNIMIVILCIFSHEACFAQDAEVASPEIQPATQEEVQSTTTTAPLVWPSHGDSLYLRLQKNSVIDDFKLDCDEAETTIRPGALADAWIRSGSKLSVWAQYPDYIGMLEILQKSYGYLSPEEINDAVDFRLQELTGETFDCFVCMDAGLMAMTTGRFSDAANCFARAADSEFYRGNPSPHIMRGRSFLKQGRLEAAMEAYETALSMVESASPDPTLLFRVRYTQAQDLFDHGLVDTSREVRLGSLESDYIPERLWAISQEVDYLWCKRNMEDLEIAVEDLEYLLSVVQPRPDVIWENSRIRYGQKVLERVTGALEGDPVKQMIMDEESLEWEYQAGNFQAVVDRLDPWVKQYPIADYNKWNPELQEWATWVHWTYNISVCNLGYPESASEGLLDLITNMPFEHSPARIANAWCWLGHCYGLMGRYAEGVGAYETGLGLDIHHVDPYTAMTPVGFDQPRVLGGHVNQEWRAKYVELYRILLRYYAFGEDFERNRQNAVGRVGK